MAHISLKLNLKALPGAKYMNVDGFDKPCIVIPNDTEMFEQDKEYDAVNLKMMLWQQSFDPAKPDNPTHRAKLNLPEELRTKRKSAMVAYLNGLTDEQYTLFCIDKFQNKQGTANMPQTREEAAAWYCSRKDELGAAWEQKPQAMKTEGAAVAATPVAAAVPGGAPSGYVDDLPF